MSILLRLPRKLWRDLSLIFPSVLSKVKSNPKRLMLVLVIIAVVSLVCLQAGIFKLADSEYDQMGQSLALSKDAFSEGVIPLANETASCVTAEDCGLGPHSFICCSSSSFCSRLAADCPAPFGACLEGCSVRRRRGGRPPERVEQTNRCFREKFYDASVWVRLEGDV